MKTSLKVVPALAALMTAGSAHALMAGGVTWDPNSLFDFTTTDTMVETIANNVGETITGYAKITTLNGTSEATFCPGCELTYRFTGYTIADNVGGLTFTGGQIDVFVDNTPDFDLTLASTATDGLLWLSLVGHSHVDSQTGEVGTLHSDPTPASTGVAGDGRGFLDVAGGLAGIFFDTDTFVTAQPGGGTANADFQFTSSFQLLPNGSFVSDDGLTYGLFGSNDLQGNSIPEPATLTLLGLAAFGLARAGSKKAKR